jgi:hypothetical protein
MIKATLGGGIEFELLELNAGSRERAAVEKAAAGVDGVVSVDMGGRSREIMLRGRLRMFSAQSLDAKIEALGKMVDGECHVLGVGGRPYIEDLRVDSVRMRKKAYSGGGLICEFELTGAQLGDQWD